MLSSKSFAAIALALAISQVIASSAEACTLAQRPLPFPLSLRSGAMLEVPPNVVLFSGSCLTLPNGSVRDEPLSMLLGQTALRPMGDLMEGTLLSAPTRCGAWSLSVTGPADRAAPSEVVIDRVRTIRVRNPNTGAGFSCSQPDTLEVYFTTRDDRTLAASIGMLAFVGGTVEEVSALRAASIVFAPELAAPAGAGVPSSTHVLRAWLGVNGARQGITPFDRTAPMCFSLASMDLAGNISARSVPRCVDTVSPSDPTVEFVQGSSGCSVRGPMPTRSAFPCFALLASIVAVSVVRQRVRRVR
ncbi:MAG: hypothetical protein Q8Q09_26070 [Deltaproteobacteria bacterium]|nr:hypothetical protein [Deltaproteobacteria bacterium]